MKLAVVVYAQFICGLKIVFLCLIISFCVCVHVFSYIDCNFAKGKWVADQKWPLYSGNECKQWLSKMWACRMMKRADYSYESFRWQPRGCEIPEFTGPNFLDR
jgi:hypothetical protein